MKKSIILIFSSFLFLGLAGCDTFRTATNAPDRVTDEVQAPTAQEAQDAQADATSETRRRQLDADIQAREERNNLLNDGAATNRSDSDLASQVRSKLEANLPASALVVESENGNVTISGTVPTQQQYERIPNLAKEIKGVNNVTLNVAVAPAQPEN
ncbi:BON domain-containing protein [Calothrix sp. NIES-3974]|uniref:BON domain-containing protein n=1 Tax=Calothrix sp. NIES-3974 TaxID=2005462 RepID=UPI000B5E95AF|nr:BON domain-containing protein [Calothrix sp. NIES-3974]BAZ03429.1 transport-associated protein [Calothrix sp. NIES-3974]